MQASAALPRPLREEMHADRHHRAASLAERFVTTRALGYPVIPNPALIPEDGWSS